MKTKKHYLVCVGILIFSSSSCYGQGGEVAEKVAAVLTKFATEKVEDLVPKPKPLNPLSIITDTALLPRPVTVKLPQGDPYLPEQNSVLGRRLEIGDSLQNNPSLSKIPTLPNSELLRIYYYSRLRMNSGAHSGPSEKTLKLVEKEIQNRKFWSEEDLTLGRKFLLFEDALAPYILCPILEDSNAPEQLKSIVRHRIFMNEISAHLHKNSFVGENDFKDTNKDLNNISIWMWIFIVLSIVLVVLSIYYSYRHFKSHKRDRKFVVDDNGTIYLQEEEIE